MSGESLKRDDRLGKWIIRELVGAGGMGKVYRAYDSVLQREVALKTLEPGLVIEQSGIPESEILERFKREAQAVAKVRHPNVVEVISYDEIDGRPVIEMELLHGENLGQLGRKGPFTIDRAVDIILGVCAGVSACHRRGIVHRDLKPQNIFIAFNDELQQEFVKVLDFGVSKLAIAADLTHDGRLLGTPTYMSPEQAAGKTADSRSDQYSIGVLLYLCLTSRSPYGASKGKDMFAILAAVRAGEIQTPREVRPEIPKLLEDVVLRAMKMLPEERFSSAQELGRQLLDFASPRGREQWNQYFTNPPVAVMSSQVPVPVPGPAPTGSTAAVTVRDKDKPSTSLPNTTVNNNHVVTAVDGRFTATTVRGESPNADATDTNPGTLNPTPWPMPKSLAVRSQSKRPLRRAGLVVGISLLVVVGALVRWGLQQKISPAAVRGAVVSAHPSEPVTPPKAAVPAPPSPRIEAPGAVANPEPSGGIPPHPVSPPPIASDGQERGNKAARSVEKKKRKNAHRPVPGEKTPDGIPLID